MAVGAVKGLLFRAEPGGLIVMAIGIAYIIIKHRKSGRAWLEATFGKIAVKGFVASFLGWPMIISGFLMCFPDLWSDLWNFGFCVAAFAIYYFLFRKKQIKNDDESENQKKAGDIIVS